MMKIKVAFAGVLSALMISSALTLPSQAQYYHAHTSYRQAHPVKSYFYRHPYQKKALIGGGIGAAGGALLGGRSGLVKGAVLGGAAGTGYEYLKRRGTF